MSKGIWPKDDIRRTFVAGAAWWEYHSTRFTMWRSDQTLAEEEAEKRYGSQQPEPKEKDRNDTIKNIANLVVEEAHTMESHNDLLGSICRVQELLKLELIKRKHEIWQTDRAWRLKKEIGSE